MTKPAGSDDRSARPRREVLVVGALPEDVIAEIEAAEYGIGPRQAD